MPTPDAQTPLTDAAIDEAASYFYPLHPSIKAKRHLVFADFARDLEKRLAAATADKERAERLLHRAAMLIRAHTNHLKEHGNRTEISDHFLKQYDDFQAARAELPQTQGREEG